MKKLLLIDGHSILNRAFFALPLLTNSKGVYTNAVHGFLSIMMKFAETEKPDYLMVAFDEHAPTFRHELYAEYKGTRSKMADELRMQVPMIQELLSKMNVPIIKKAGLEADDILGTIAKTAQNQGMEVTICSGDRDLLQLADEHIKIAIPKTKAGQTTVEEYKSSDVIEKMGVTPTEFIDVKALWGDTSDNIPGVTGIGEKTAFALISQYHSLEEAYAHVEELKPKRASENLKAEIETARLSKVLATIDINSDVEFDITKGDFSNPFTQEAYELCLEWELKQFLKRFDGKATVPEKEKVYEDGFVKDIYVTKDLKSLLHAGGNLPAKEGDYFDLSLAAYLTDPNRKEYDFSDSTEDEYQRLITQLEKADLLPLYFDIELPLCYVLYEMEKEGIALDTAELAEFGRDLAQKISQLENEIHEDCGGDFNINSPKQLGEVLFERMGLPGGKKTKTGYSTAADVLEKLAGEYPVVNKILLYRQYAKLKSTYADGLAQCVADDGRVHTTFQQTVAATGRLSSTNPNLQNIPIRLELGREIRKSFKAKEGYTFVDGDYSQIELRVLAHMSGDENLIEAYRENKDIHRSTAAKVFNIPFEQVTDAQRSAAKAVNFGIVYGISSFGLGEDLKISRKEAQKYIDDYYVAYPSLKGFLDGLINFAKENGYSKTMYGRRRPVPELKASNFMQRQFGERIAMNTPIQGTAADIIKIAMVRVSKRLKEEGLLSKLILQVHDELLIEAKDSELEKVRAILKEEMEQAANLSVPLVVDIHEGKSWFEAK